MKLGQPHHIEAPALGGVDLREGFLERLALASAGEGRKLMEHAEFHGAFLLVAARRTGDRMPTGMKDSASRRGPAIMPRILRQGGGDEAVLRRRRGDPRGVSQPGPRSHYLLAGLGMVAGVGGARPPKGQPAI